MRLPVAADVRGIGLALALALIAWGLNEALHGMGWFSPGASGIALVLGALAAPLMDDLEAGGRWLTKEAMPFAIVLLGFGLSLKMFLDPAVGLVGLAAGGVTVIVAMSLGLLLGRAFGLSREVAIAVGAGGAICGNSAVIAVAPGLRLKDAQLGLILAMVNLMGMITFVGIPVASKFLGLTPTQAGVWAGATVHAVPQAIAAGEVMGPQSMIIATAGKLARVSMLVLVVPLCAYLCKGESTSPVRALPWFVPGFVVTAILATWVLSPATSAVLAEAGNLVMLPLMAGVGYFVNVASIRAAGGPILKVGAISTLAFAAASLGVILLLT